MAQATAPTITEPEAAADPFAAAWQAVRGAHQIVVEAIEAELSAAGLPDLAWHDVLTKLDRSASPVRPKDMLCQVNVTKSGLTRLLDRIEKAGLIERTYCPSDRRGTFVNITEEGHRTLAEMKPIRDRVFQEHFESSMTRKEAEEVRATLNRVVASVGGHLEATGDCDV